MLSHDEICYLKTILKQETENWENKSTLNDLYRHCKFTIRKLTRQMANIDNRTIFKNQKKIDRNVTLLMVYRAERLHSALGDAQKVFKLVAQLIFDEKDFQLIWDNAKTLQFKESDEKFMKKREQLIKRI